MSHRSSQKSLLAALPCALFLAALATGQAFSNNTIMGKVRSQTGQPVVGVLVELQSGNGLPLNQSVTTNEGDFIFTGLEGASFIVVINDFNYQPFADRVELSRMATTRPGDIVRVDVTLIPKTDQASSRSGAVSRPGVVFHQSVPDAAIKAYRHGMKLLAERKSDEGLAALAEAIKIFPEYFDAHLAVAFELMRLRRYDQAVAALERARKVNPRDSRLYYGFGLVVFEQKKFDLAAKVFEAAARLNPSHSEAYLMRGAALIEVGRLDLAEAELKRAFQVSQQKLALAHIHLARVYEKRGERSRAADELESYLNKKPNAENAQAIREAIKKLRAG